MGKTAILSVRIISDAKKAVQGFQETSRAADLMSKAVDLAKGTLVAGAAATGAFAVQAVKNASSLEQSQGAVAAVFGDSAKKMEELSASASKNLGLTKNEFNELSTVIGSQLKNGGTAIDELAPKTSELIGIGADLSAMFGGTTRDAVDALSAALRGERDPIEKYGVSLNQAAVDAKAAELGFQKVGGALTTEANQAATLALIMEQTTAAHGAFSRESGTLANQAQVLSAEWGNFSATMGEYLLPYITKVVSYANTNLMPWLNDMAQKVPQAAQKVQEMGTAFSNFTQEHQNKIDQIVKTVGIILIPTFIRLATTAGIAAAAQVASWALSSASAIAAGAVYVTQSFLIVGKWAFMGVQALLHAGKMAVAWVIALGPVGWVTAAIIAIAVVVIMNWEKIVEWTKNAWSIVSSWTSEKWNAVKQSISDSVNNTKQWVADSWNVIVTRTKENWSAITSWTSEKWAAIKNSVSSAVTEMVLSVREKGAQIVEFFRTLPATINSHLTGFRGELWATGAHMIDGLIGGIKAKATAAVDAVKGVVNNAVSGAKSLLGIKSPSRLFRDEIGAQMGAGLELGLNLSRSKVLEATQRMIDVSSVKIDSFKSEPMRIESKLSGTDSSTKNGSNIVNNIEIKFSGLVTDPLSVAKEIERILKFKNEMVSYA